MPTTAQRMSGNSPGAASNRSAGAVTKVAQAAVEQFPSLAEQFDVLKHDVAELASQAGTAAKHQVKPIEQFVEREPLKAVLLAAGLGCVLGFLFSRR